MPNALNYEVDSIGYGHFGDGNTTVNQFLAVSILVSIEWLIGALWKIDS